MTPFMQFRIWFRRATPAQRAGAAAGVALLAALIVWSAVPSSNGGSSALLAIGGPGGATAGTVSAGRTGSGTGGTGNTLAGGQGSSASGAAAGGDTTGASGGAVAGDAGSGASSGGFSTGGGSGLSSSGPATGSATSPGSGSTPAAGGSSPTTGAPQSCTKMGKLEIGAVVPEGAGGAINSVIGNPPTSQEEADYAAVFDSVNKAGGVDCYDLEGVYAASDLTNPSSAQSGCLAFQQDKVFAVLGGFEPLFSDDCMLQAHIPTFDELAVPYGTVKKFYPYYYSPDPTYEVLYKNFVDAVNQLGYFGSAHHFAKLGIFYYDCTPEIHQALLSDLASVGVSGSKVDSFDLGCSSAFASPSAVEQAVLQFKTDGVTTATIDADIADGQNISNIANSQGFKPQWILPDIGDIAVQNSSVGRPNAAEWNGAVAITASQYGAVGANLPETAPTQACDKIMTSHGLPTVYASGDQFAGSVCSEVWMLVGALQHGSVSAAGIVAGLQAAKSIALSFPNGPNDFSAPGTTWGEQFWREDTYHASCSCWATDNPAWNPSFS